MQSNDTVERFKFTDLDEIKVRTELQASLEELKKEFPTYRITYMEALPIFTYRSNGEIIMIYGMAYMGCGTYTPVILMSENGYKKSKSVIKYLYSYYATYVDRNNVRRLEAQCDIQDSKAIRLAKHFGFDVVGIRHCASAEGHDQAILERLCMCDPRKAK